MHKQNTWKNQEKETPRRTTRTVSAVAEMLDRARRRNERDGRVVMSRRKNDVASYHSSIAHLQISHVTGAGSSASVWVSPHKTHSYVATENETLSYYTCEQKAAS
jgi:hypothetical protein